MSNEPAKPEYRFSFKITDETSGEVVWRDFTYMTDIDDSGFCDSVNIHVSSMLLGFRRHVRAEYEAKEYPAPEPVEEDA